MEYKLIEGSVKGGQAKQIMEAVKGVQGPCLSPPPPFPHILPFPPTYLSGLAMLAPNCGLDASKGVGERLRGGGRVVAISVRGAEEHRVSSRSIAWLQRPLSPPLTCPPSPSPIT